MGEIVGKITDADGNECTLEKGDKIVVLYIEEGSSLSEEVKERLVKAMAEASELEQVVISDTPPVPKGQLLSTCVERYMPYEDLDKYSPGPIPRGFNKKHNNFNKHFNKMNRKSNIRNMNMNRRGKR